MPAKPPFSLVLLFLALAAGGVAQDPAMREAARLDAEGKCAESEPYYQQALAKGGPSPALLNNAGNHYLVCGQPEKARGYFELLLKTNPSHGNANLQLARIWTDRREGARALEHLARVNDSSPAVLLLRVEALHLAGNQAMALTILDSLEKEAAGDVRFLFTLGMTCAKLNLFDRAERSFQEVAMKLPGNFEVLYNLGRAAARAQHYERAQSSLEVALKLRPGDVDVLLELGLLHAARQDYSRAVFVLAQARERAPARVDVLLALARAAEDAGYYGDSALVYDEYLKLKPGDDIARRDRARVYGHTGARLEEGLKELEWYIKKYPKDPLGYYILAQFSWRTEPEKCLEQLSTALRLDPEFGPAQLSMGWLLHRLGRTAGSIPHLQAAVRLLPDKLRAMDQLGLAYLTLDQPANAEKVLRQALAIAPEDPEVLMHLGRTLMALGREEEAQTYLVKFKNLRRQIARDPRREPGMIEAATLSAPERAQREIERLRKIVIAHPGDAEFQSHLAGLLLAEGHVEEALGRYRQLLRMSAESRIWEQAGKSLVRYRQYELACEFLEEAVEERPVVRLDLAIAVFFAKGAEQALQVLDQVPKSERGGDYLLLKAQVVDSTGRTAEAEETLREGLRLAGTRPDVAQQAALLLVRKNKHADAVGLLEQAAQRSQDSPDLLLTQAVVAGLMDRVTDSEKMLQRIESRWPEWDRPYLVHGLLLERGQSAEARQRFQTALALGSQDLAARCALARVEQKAPPDPKCDCVKGLYEFLFPACEKTQEAGSYKR